MTNQAPANTTSAAGSGEAAREGGKQCKMVPDPPRQARRCCQSRGPCANPSRKGGSTQSPQNTHKQNKSCSLPAEKSKEGVPGSHTALKIHSQRGPATSAGGRWCELQLETPARGTELRAGRTDRRTARICGCLRMHMAKAARASRNAALSLTLGSG